MLETLGAYLVNVNHQTREFATLSSHAPKSFIPYALAVSLRTPEEIGELLREWRRGARLSQQALAGLTGVGQKTLSLMEQGQSMTLENVWALLRYYGKGPEALTKDAPRNAPEAPGTHPPPPEGSIPLSEFRSVVRAYEAQISALERQRRDLPAEELYRLRQDANDEGSSTTPPPAKPGSGSRSKKDRPPSRSGHQP